MSWFCSDRTIGQPWYAGCYQLPDSQKHKLGRAKAKAAETNWFTSISHTTNVVLITKTEVCRGMEILPALSSPASLHPWSGSLAILLPKAAFPFIVTRAFAGLDVTLNTLYLY